MPWNDRFEELLRTQLPEVSADAPLAPDTDLRAAGLDSLGTMELVVALEQAFGIEVPDEALTYETFTTTSSLWKTVDHAIRSQAEAVESAS